MGLIARKSAGSISTPSLRTVAASALALFLYALPFSLAYRGLSAGTGAFVVFGCVQILSLIHI